MRKIEKKARALGWSVVYHTFAGWRCVRNEAATDDDVTDYCETESDAWDEAFRISVVRIR